MMKENVASIIPQVPVASRPRSDVLAPSVNPPGGLSPAQVPQFVVLACDDNPHVESMRWLLDFLKEKKNPAGSGQTATFDGVPVRTSFYSCGKYLDWEPKLQALHREAYEQGHEIGNHSHNHPQGGDFSVAEWVSEMEACQAAFSRAGIPPDSVHGFRTPYVEFSKHTFEAITKLGFSYDASLEEGAQSWVDGSNFLWPYTLDSGSPGNAFLADGGFKNPIGEYKGLWHIGNNYVIVPPDEKCEQYNCRAGLRDRVYAAIKKTGSWEWDKNSGKLAGFDYNMWVMAEMSPAESLATLKYTLDLRLNGNRAPFLFGAHVECNPDTEPGKRESLEAFVDYALEKEDVRFVPAFRIVEWVRDPHPLLIN